VRKNEINFKKWDESDLGSLVKYANNKNISDNLTDAFPYPYTKSDGKIS
jgi:ribosomal-protein-alanine N-acetyltransferase